MHFDLIQSLSLAGKPEVPNDDRIGCAERHAWVIDGATDLGEPGLLGERGGAAWLSGTAQRAFAAGAGTLQQICEQVFDTLAERFESDRLRDPLSSWELPRAAFAAVALEGAELVCAHLADCVVLHRSATGVRFLTPEPDHEAECAAAAALGDGVGAHGIRPPSVLADRRSAREHSREVLSIDASVSKAHTRYSRCTVAPGDDVVLMSDGLAALLSPYKMHTVNTFMRRLQSHGLASLACELRQIEADDTSCIRFPRFKKSDDASAIWLRVC